MDDLLSRVLDAHGGLERWSAVNTLTTRLSLGGPFWGRRGFPDAFLEETLEIDAHREHAVFTPWIAPDQTLTLVVAPERVSLQAADGQTVDSRTDPRSSYPRYEHNVFLRDHSPSDRLEVGYFLSYAMWNYLTAPFLFTYPGVTAREIEPWPEDGQTWRRRQVNFPDTVATHNPEQPPRPSTASSSPLAAASTGEASTESPTSVWPRSPSTSTTSPSGSADMKAGAPLYDHDQDSSARDLR